LSIKIYTLPYKRRDLLKPLLFVVVVSKSLVLYLVEKITHSRSEWEQYVTRTFVTQTRDVSEVVSNAVIFNVFP